MRRVLASSALRCGPGPGLGHNLRSLSTRGDLSSQFPSDRETRSLFSVSWTKSQVTMAVLRHKESIHSGQFMVSNLEPEENCGEDTDLDVAGEEGLTRDEVISETKDQTMFQSVFCPRGSNKADKRIDNSLSKLFSCMSKVYAHKLSSPKWNRFLGLKLRWKDKIRYQCTELI